MAVSLDEAFLAYGLIDDARFGRYALYVQHLASGKTTLLSTSVPQTTLEQGMSSAPAWSPNGKYLAFIDGKTGKSRLRIWNRTSGAFVTVEDVYACSFLAACVHDVIQWSPQSEMVYFLGTRSAAAPRTDVTLENVGARTEKGVSIRTTASKRKQLAHIAVSAADIFAYALPAQRSVQLTQDGQFGNFRLSPDGLLILGARPGSRSPVGVKQALHDYHLLSAKPASEPLQFRPAGRPIEPVAVARQWQAAFRWAPDSRRVAFIESGSQTDGDVLVLDVTTGVVDVLTQGSPFGRVSDFDRTASAARHFGYPGTKFGNSLEAPIWMPSGSQVLVSRAGMEGGNRRVRLWQIDVTSGELVRLGSDDACDVAGFAPAGANVGIALMEQCEDRLRVSRVEPGKAKVTQIVSFPGAQPSTFQFIDEHIFFPLESAVSPPEIVNVLIPNGTSETITAVNAEVHRGDLRVHTVTWTSADGRVLQAPLYFKESGRRDLIVHVYPPDFFVYSPPRLNEFPDVTRLPPVLAGMLDRGYAVLERPNMMQAGGGHTCDRLGSDIVEALDAVAKTGLVDVSRPGIYGESFGGYSANCIITRTKRFKAAVSVAGFSDLISLHFTSTSGEVTIAGGGQVGAMGSSLWDVPLRYWQESPVAGVMAVQTPLLLVHGALDRQVPVSQSREMFEALSNLDKDVTLVEYTDGDHGSSFLSSRDFKKRVVEFFDSRLRPSRLD